MAFPDIFKKRKKLEPVEKPEKKESEEEIKPQKPSKKAKKKVPELAYRILVSPRITERATDLGKQNQYVFNVFPKANKIEIKKVIEQIYRVNVLNVKIINIPRKPKRLGKTQGFKKGYKKAIIKIKSGQKIETLPH